MAKALTTTGPPGSHEQGPESRASQLHISAIKVGRSTTSEECDEPDSAIDYYVIVFFFVYVAIEVTSADQGLGEGHGEVVLISDQTSVQVRGHG